MSNNSGYKHLTAGFIFPTMVTGLYFILKYSQKSSHTFSHISCVLLLGVHQVLRLWIKLLFFLLPVCSLLASLSIIMFRYLFCVCFVDCFFIDQLNSSLYTQLQINKQLLINNAYHYHLHGNNIINCKMKLSPAQRIDLAIITQKQSNTGMFKNQRLLLIKSGFVSYYSEIPKFYVGNVRSLELSGQLPKMTLPATGIQSIQRKRKYLHIKFNKKHLIPIQKLKNYIDNIPQPKTELQNQNQQWVLKCENVQQADTFMQQVLLYKNDPTFVPQLDSIVEGYREGRKWFRSESMRLTAVGGMGRTGGTAHRYSEQPQAIVNKFRTNSVSGAQFILDNHPESNNNNQIANSTIHQKVQQQNEQQPKQPTKNTPTQKKSPIEQKIQTLIQPKQQKQKQPSTYSKQTYPYYPFIKNKKSSKKEQLQLSLHKFVKEDQRLLEKLMNNKNSGKKVQMVGKKIEPQPQAKPKRSLTLGSIKKQSIRDKKVQNKAEQNVVRNSSWSQLKKLKRAYSMLGSLNWIGNGADEQEQQKQQQQHQDQQNNQKQTEKAIVKQVNNQIIVQQEPTVLVQNILLAKQNKQTPINHINPNPNNNQDHNHNHNQDHNLNHNQDHNLNHNQDHNLNHNQELEQSCREQIKRSGVPQLQLPSRQKIEQIKPLDCSIDQHSHTNDQSMSATLIQWINQSQNVNHSQNDIEQVMESPPIESKVEVVDTIRQKQIAVDVRLPIEKQIVGQKMDDDQTNIEIRPSTQNKGEINGQDVFISQSIKQSNQNTQKVKIFDLKPIVQQQQKQQQIKDDGRAQVNNNNGLNYEENNNQDAISFKDLQIEQKCSQSYLPTPRFWEKPLIDQQQPIQQLKNSKQIKSKPKQKHEPKYKPVQTSTKYLQQSHLLSQKQKTHQQKQTQHEISLYITELLTPSNPLHHQQQLCGTVRKIARLTNSNFQIPMDLILELKAIREETMIKKVCIGMLIDYVDNDKQIDDNGDGVDCEGIMFGTRIRWDGWCMYLYQTQAHYSNIIEFYKMLAQKSQLMDKNFHIRPARLFGLHYKSHYAIFLQNPHNPYPKLLPNLQQSLRSQIGQHFYEQIKQQIKISQEFNWHGIVLWVNPDYLCKQSMEMDKNMDIVMNVDIGSIVKYAWQQYVGSQPNQKAQRLQIVNLVLKRYQLDLKYSTSQYPQVYHTCSMEQPQFKPSSHIDTIHSNILSKLSHDPQKMSHIIHWKSLKLLAEADLHEQQNLDVCSLIHLLTTMSQLYAMKSQYQKAYEICCYIVAVLLGEQTAHKLVGTGAKIDIKQTKMVVVVGLEGLQDVCKLCQCLFTNLILIINTMSILEEDKGAQYIDRLYQSFLQISAQLYDMVLNKAKGKQSRIQEIYSYHSLILHQLYYKIISNRQNCPQEKLIHIKKCAYVHAQYILHKWRISSPQKIQAAQATIIGYIDELVQLGRLKDARFIINSQLSVFKGQQGNDIYEMELCCRQDLCLLLTNQSLPQYSQFVLYLEFYLSQTSSNLTLIKSLTLAICSEYAYNNEAIFYHTMGLLQKSNLQSQFISQILEEGLAKIQPVIRKRIQVKING